MLRGDQDQVTGSMEMRARRLQDGHADGGKRGEIEIELKAEERDISTKVGGVHGFRSLDGECCSRWPRKSNCMTGLRWEV